ncbi:MAG: aryl-sulfate sulfotransferase [Myxococcota bacterium]|nr:aryl-sulfate sulfotransferase [Myxococcota bacterium]
MLILSLLACTTSCPEGSVLRDDGLCHLDTNETVDDTAADTTPVDTTPDGAADPFEITTEVSEYVRTVVTVRWKTEAETTGYIEFGEGADYGRITPTTASGTEHEAQLLGLWADTEFHFRVVSAEDGGEDWISDDYTVTTGSLPPEIPQMSFTGEAGWEGFIFAPIQGINYLAAAIDSQGRVVWYKVLESSTHHVMRAQMLDDGSAVAICMAGQDSQGNKEDGYVLLVSMDGSVEQEVAVPYIDHDMTLKPDGTIVGIVLKTEDGFNQYADSIQEVTHDGEMTQIFNAWDHVDWLTDEPLGGNNWTHANALDYYPEEDAYYMAMKELHTMVKVDAPSGEVQWAFGGTGNQFTFADGTIPLSMHHQFHIFDEDRLVVFENGESSRGYSMAREFVLDTENMIATEVWSYVREPSVFVFAKGDVERLDSGNTLVTWSSSGEIQEVTPDGDVVWQVNTDLGSAITFIDRVESLYGE